jgi:hypothetical protein
VNWRRFTLPGEHLTHADPAISGGRGVPGVRAREQATGKKAMVLAISHPTLTDQSVNKLRKAEAMSDKSPKSTAKAKKQKADKKSRVAAQNLPPSDPNTKKS